MKELFVKVNQQKETDSLNYENWKLVLIQNWPELGVQELDNNLNTEVAQNLNFTIVVNLLQELVDVLLLIMFLAENPIDSCENNLNWETLGWTNDLVLEGILEVFAFILIDWFLIEVFLVEFVIDKHAIGTRDFDNSFFVVNVSQLQNLLLL